jgi:hypothetical protein
VGRLLRTVTLGGLLVLPAALSGCEPAQHPRQLTKKFVENLCHVAFDCCTAVERSAVGPALGFPSRDACRAELDVQVGGAMAAAVQAVDRGNATFDADAARACTEAGQAAIDACAGGDAFIDVDGFLSGERAGMGISDDDPECQALAARGFTRGLIDDGDDCVSDFECADFGDCVIDDDDGAGLTRAGACRAHAARGDECSARPCQPGLVCVSGRCDNPPARAEDGEACDRDSGCASGFCRDDGDSLQCATPDIDSSICDGHSLPIP